MDQPSTEDMFVFCIPIFNDWDCARELLRQIDEVAFQQAWQARVLFVDDGSTDKLAASKPIPMRCLKSVEVLGLRCNVGHQRAIALGITHICQKHLGKIVVVMDGDGDDAPKDTVALVSRLGSFSQPRIVFAQRSERSEGLLFRIFYRVFQLFFRLLVGRKMDVGNFSVIPQELLQRLVGVGDLWNHYAAAVVKSRIPMDKVPVARARRLHGNSKMNFVGLVSHGLSAISVFSEEVGARLLTVTMFLSGLAFLGMFVVVGIRLFTELAIPGWATMASAGLATILANSILLSLAFSFLILRGRNTAMFIPLRDYTYFIQGVTRLDVSE